MSETSALQEEEREVLLSIYEGDECFKNVNSTTFQYKVRKFFGKPNHLH